MEKRIEKLRSLIKEKGAGGALITSCQNRFYYSGFYGTAGYLVITADSLYIITDSRYTLQAREQAKGFTLITGSETDFTKAYDIIRREGVTSVCYEDISLCVSEYMNMGRALDGVELVPLGESITRQRAVKDSSEIKKIREALRLADEAFSYTVGLIRPGIREVEVAALLEGYMRKNGAAGSSFDTVAASGARSALPHGTATGAEIKSGDLLVLDYGCVLDGYCSDITRTVSIGAANEKQREIYDTVDKAGLAAELFLRPSVSCAEVDKKAREVIDARGMGKYFTHSLGHGVGIDVHELPVLSPRSDKELEIGNIVTIEPGIYIENFGGVRIEDMALITENGAEILTKATRELICV